MDCLSALDKSFCSAAVKNYLILYKTLGLKFIFIRVLIAIDSLDIASSIIPPVA